MHLPLELTCGFYSLLFSVYEADRNFSYFDVIARMEFKMKDIYLKHYRCKLLKVLFHT